MTALLVILVVLLVVRIAQSAYLALRAHVQIDAIAQTLTDIQGALEAQNDREAKRDEMRSAFTTGPGRELLRQRLAERLKAAARKGEGNLNSHGRRTGR